MKSRNVIVSLILILLVVGFAIIRMRWWEPQRKEAFDRSPTRLEYTRHALCKMDCRGITELEVTEIMKKGIINFSKSDPGDRPCPTFALQGYTTDKDNIRVIFAQCNGTTRVVTCYNLKDDLDCECP
jgi:hypothetical protein